MKKFMKIFALTMSIAMFATGCQSSGQPAATTASAENSAKTEASTAAENDKPVTLKFSWWGSDSRHEAMQKVADLYTAKHPNVTIETEYGAFDGWQQKVLTQLAGKTEADVMQVNYNWVHSFGKGKNIFADLKTLPGVDLSNWDQSQIDSMTVDGQVAAVPHGVTARANFYNKALFEAAGVSYPATYEEIIAAGKAIGKDNTATGAENKYVLTNIGKVSTDLYIAQMLFNRTGKVMQENGTMNYTIDEVKDIFSIYKSFEDAAAFPTLQQEDSIQNESNPVWTAGNSGSVYEWVGTADKYLNSYKGGEAKDEISVAPWVTEKAGDVVKVFVKPSLGYAISRNCKNPEVAADFLNFMFTDKEAIEALGTSLGVSSNKVSRQVQEENSMIKGAMKEGYDLLAKYEQVTLDPYFEDENVRGKRYDVIEAFRSGSITLEQAASDYITKQQTELDKLYK